MIKILHVLPDMDPKAGGVCQAVRSIVEYTSSEDVVNEVVCLDEPGAPYLEEEKFNVHALRKGKTAWNYHPNLIKWLKEHLGTFDKVVVHGLWQYQSFAVYTVWSKLKKNKPSLYVMPHGMLDPYFQKAEGRKLKALRNQIFWQFVERNLVNQADGLLFTCETEMILARQPFKPYLPKKEFVVGLGVEKPPFFTQSMVDQFYLICHEVIGQKYLLFISRLHPKKGVDILIKAYLSLAQTNIVLPKLVIAGPGLDTEYGKEMVALAQSHPDIVFPGMLTGAAKWGAFYSCEAFILPSHQENFGIAVVEALACRKPVLITDQVNIFREILEGRGGLVEDDTQIGVQKLLTSWTKLNQEEKYVFVNDAERTYEKYFSPAQAALSILKVLKT